MEIQSVSHIAVAVKSLSEAVAGLENVLGLKASAIEEIPSEKVRVQFVEIGGVRFEFLEATSDDSPIAKFIAKRGAGIHHVALDVKDIQSRLDELKAKGIPLIHETAKEGAEGCKVGFVHPKAIPGILLELVEGHS
jgi:methylmalonyl-CoA epimerase